jgi:hypothetical protein
MPFEPASIRPPSNDFWCGWSICYPQVFWSASGGQAFPTDDGVQPDAPDGAE